MLALVSAAGVAKVAWGLALVPVMALGFCEVADAGVGEGFLLGGQSLWRLWYGRCRRKCFHWSSDDTMVASSGRAV